MRASRLLSLLMLLQSRGHVSAQAIARELEVSVRTVYRDVDELSAAGVPIWADRGRAGGFQLQPGWRTRVDGLTAPEAQAMFLGGLPGPASELGLGEGRRWRRRSSSCSRRCRTAGARTPAASARASISIRSTGYRGPSATDHLPAIARAVWGERRVAMRRYDSWKGEVERRVEPLGLVLKAGVWYLVARAAKEAGGSRTDARTYRVSNVLALTIGDDRFERPPSFDLAAWWLASTRRFEAELARDTAVLRVSPAGMKALRDLGAAVAAAAEASAGRADAQGWRRVTIPIESVAHAAGQLIRLGVEAKVVRPAALRRELIARLDAMAALYRGARRPGVNRGAAVRAAQSSQVLMPPFLIIGSWLTSSPVVALTTLTVYAYSFVSVFRSSSVAVVVPSHGASGNWVPGLVTTMPMAGSKFQPEVTIVKSRVVLGRVGAAVGGKQVAVPLP